MSNKIVALAALAGLALALAARRRTPPTISVRPS